MRVSQRAGRGLAAHVSEGSRLGVSGVGIEGGPEAPPAWVGLS
jgi:hypothetical protein